MNIFKKIIAFVLCLTLVFCVPLTASATSFDAVDEYIEFTPANARMSSDGSFTFNIKQYVNSTVFTANSSTIRIDTSAKVYDTSSGNSHTDNSVSFTLTLYKASTNEKVAAYLAYADGVYGGLNFTVTNGAKYYFIITCNTALYSTEYLRGSGRVSPVTVG